MNFYFLKYSLKTINQKTKQNKTKTIHHRYLSLERMTRARKVFDFHLSENLFSTTTFLGEETMNYS